MWPGLERNGFYSIIPSLFSLWRNHYKGAFEDSGHVVCPEGLMRAGALSFWQQRVWLYPWSLIVFLFISLSSEGKIVLSLLTTTVTVEIYFHPSSSALFFWQKVYLQQNQAIRGCVRKLRAAKRNEISPVMYVMLVHISSQTPQWYPHHTSQLTLRASSLSKRIIAGTHIHAQICLYLTYSNPAYLSTMKTGCESCVLGLTQSPCSCTANKSNAIVLVGLR